MNQNKMIKIADWILNHSRYPIDEVVWAFGETITMGSSIGEVIK